MMVALKQKYATEDGEQAGTWKDIIRPTEAAREEEANRHSSVVGDPKPATKLRERPGSFRTEGRQVICPIEKVMNVPDGRFASLSLVSTAMSVNTTVVCRGFW